jgi:predicted lipoprotein
MNTKEERAELSYYFANDKFDARQYVSGIWEEKVLPYMEERAMDIPSLIDGLRSDPAATCERYGYRAVEENNPYNFSVKGRFKVLSISSESNARIEADVEPFDGAADVVIQVGPIIRGTSIRDLLDFVKFEDFTNQVDFAKLANELNFKVRDEVTGRFEFREKDYRGRVFEILGATTYLSGDSRLVIVPARLELMEDE